MPVQVVNPNHVTAEWFSLSLYIYIHPKVILHHGLCRQVLSPSWSPTQLYEHGRHHDASTHGHDAEIWRPMRMSDLLQLSQQCLGDHTGTNPDTRGIYLFCRFLRRLWTVSNTKYFWHRYRCVHYRNVVQWNDSNGTIQWWCTLSIDGSICVGRYPWLMLIRILRWRRYRWNIRPDIVLGIPGEWLSKHSSHGRDCGGFRIFRFSLDDMCRILCGTYTTISWYIRISVTIFTATTAVIDVSHIRYRVLCKKSLRNAQKWSHGYRWHGILLSCWLVAMHWDTRFPGESIQTKKASDTIDMAYVVESKSGNVIRKWYQQQ